MVVPEISATRPRASSSARMSGTNSRDSGRPSRLGSSQAIALTWMVTSGGKDGGASSPGAFLQAGQALRVEAVAPLGNDLAAGVQPGGGLVVGKASRGHEDDLGADDLSIWQCIAPRLCLQDLVLLLAEFDRVWAFPGHSLLLCWETV